MTRRAKSCRALVATLLCLASPAFADKETIGLEYQAPSGCADRAVFLTRVNAFTTKAEIAGDDDSSRRKFGIRVARGGSSANAVHGELTIDDHGTKTTRSVSGATCDEVISALALATALAIDPDALGAEPAVEPPPPAETAAAKPPTPPPALEPPPPQPAPAKALPLFDEPNPNLKLEPRPALDLSLGARIGDELAPFAKLEGIAQLGTTFFAPLDFRVGVAFGPAQHNGVAQFSDWLGWFGTGYRFLDLEPVSVWGQTALELGRVRAVGRNIEPTRAVDKLWAAVNVGLSVRLDAPGPLFFEANASGRAPLSLQRYVVTENTGKTHELHQVQQFGYLLSLSVGMHFL